MTKVLVTGGTGYIGSHTVVELLNSGYEVVVIDNLCNSYIKVVDCIEKITGKRPTFYNTDLLDSTALEAIFNTHQDIAAVIHFAAHKAVGESVKKPIDYYKNNVGATVMLVEAMLKHKIEALVFSSSCTVYGEPDTLPVTENMPVKPPVSPYGNTKKICEEVIRDCTKAYSLHAISLRYFNPIGAHPSALIGELPIGSPNNLMPIVTQTAIGKRNKMQIHGGDYTTPDGSCIRDYIHVVDIAKAHVIAVERMLKNKSAAPYEAFNLGTGHGNSVFEVIEAFERTSGVKLNYEVGAKRPGDVMSIYSDTTLANTVLGWKADYDLDEMVISSWAWEKNIQNIYPEL
ncbi:MAG: UDP-glucose 4-epimerase GalE [Bacteroidetes bacterium]|nr:UDP-glucose 4-epimerase GalE [Bacteroidota bacterium]